MTRIGSLQAMFYIYAILGAIGAAFYSRLPGGEQTDAATAPAQALGPSRITVYKLAALFSLDSFAGGFTVQSLLALWLFERFDLSLAAAEYLLLLVKFIRRIFLSGRGAARKTIWARQYDGVHTYSIKPLPHCCGVCP